MTATPQTELAFRYVQHTGISLFLTGKAGTGKTTFLHEVATHCAKRHAVVAPTGVAAINAGGVTIHSFFQLPFDPYLPDIKELVTEYQLPENRKSLNKTKLNIIRTLELLIIDEISMVRADLLDAIDMTLRRYRRSSRPFGGVQLLMIGDIHQLSPVVTEAERPFMERVYPTPYFFASKALQRMPYVTIELTTVYRQQDSVFVDLLNHVRDNDIDIPTLQALNARVGKPQRGAITLTTHNRQADAINRRHMEALEGKRREFKAQLEGNFPEKNYPCERILEIKVGERVMFVKNDSSGAHRYYNGKIGTVSGFYWDDDKEIIKVVDDDGVSIGVGREQWENLKYSLDDTTGEITQEVEGRFYQYPLQAAWAVTIHKAQGLTFDRVAIDAADAFAFGQVYVALSRCRTLEGLTLTTPLTQGVAFNDAFISSFVSAQPTFEQTSAAATEYERQFRLEKLIELFGIGDLVQLAEHLQEHYGKLKYIYPENVTQLDSIISSLLSLQVVSEKFKNQLMHLDEGNQNSRALKGAEYYHSQLSPIHSALKSLLDVEIDNIENAKNINETGGQLMEILSIKLACFIAVKTQGYSVATVQNAKAKQMLEYKDESKRRNRNKKETKASGSTDEENTAFAKLLRQWRAAKAKEENVPAYTILQQKALHSIATNLPRTPSELKRQLGVGPKTIERFGDEILALIEEWLSGGV